MNVPNNQYKAHRFPREIIQHAVWIYYLFNLGQRDIEDSLAVCRCPAVSDAPHLK
jgi:transposase-like protein